VVGVVLILPALLSFVVDRLVQRKQVALLSARAVPWEPKPNRGFDALMLAFSAIVAILIVGILGVAAYASYVKLWPYDLSLSLGNYNFGNFDASGWESYWNSIRMAAWTALFGTVIVFAGAYFVEKGRGFSGLRQVVHFMAMIPLAVPGLALGIGYIFFFNAPDNPLNFLIRTMAILVICTIAHFYTVAHLTAVTALKQLDNEFEAVSASLKVPFWRTFARVTVPICLPVILDIAVYLFVNAMTTVSAVVFLYSTDSKLASVAVVSMDDAGDTAAAAAMAMMIVYTSAAVKALQMGMTRLFLQRTQLWRRR
jgi:iron(III) transport system permease protein